MPAAADAADPEKRRTDRPALRHERRGRALASAGSAPCRRAAGWGRAMAAAAPGRARSECHRVAPERVRPADGWGRADAAPRQGELDGRTASSCRPRGVERWSEHGASQRHLTPDGGASSEAEPQTRKRIASARLGSALLARGSVYLPAHPRRKRAARDPRSARGRRLDREKPVLRPSHVGEAIRPPRYTGDDRVNSRPLTCM
jgi:hypothetical protein